MYSLMHLDTKVLDFEIRDVKAGNCIEVEEINITKEYNKPWFMRDFRSWLANRMYPNNRTNMNLVLNICGVSSLRQRIEYSHAASLTDCFWINETEAFSWDEVSLFSNDFDETISEAALCGFVRYEPRTNLTPELTTRGREAKRWYRDEGGLYLLKAFNSDQALYSEQYATDLLSFLGFSFTPASVYYYKRTLVSRIAAFTDECLSFVSMSDCLPGTDLQSLIKFCEKMGIIESLCEIFVFDYLTANTKRNLKSIGILVDTDTWDVYKLAPCFNNDSAFLPHAPKGAWSSYENMCMYAGEADPLLYDDLQTMATMSMTDTIAEKLSRIGQFSFNPHEYDIATDRLEMMEKFIIKRARELIK